MSGTTTSGNKWEYVSKSKKKQPGQKLSKEQKKAYADNAPRIEPLQPLKLSKTMYDSIAEKEPSTSFQDKEQQKNGTPGKQRIVPPVQKKKKNQAQQRLPEAKGKKDTWFTLEDAAAKVSDKALEKLLTHDQAKFPENPSVWLKDMASYLNLELHLQEKDPVLVGPPVDSPYSYLPASVQKLMTNVLAKCPLEVQSLFFEHCVRAMITDFNKGLSTYGYRVCIQCVAFHQPKSVMPDLQKYLEMIRANQKSPAFCLRVIWSVVQPGHKDLSRGLEIWEQVLFPLLGIRSLTNYIITCRENLFSCHDNLTSAYQAIGMREYFSYLDLVFRPNPCLSSAAQKRLLALYPKIKTIAFGNYSNMVSFFPSLLARLGNSCPKALQDELLACLVTCLMKDNRCYTPWRQMYTKHLVQSAMLMQHLIDVWRLLKIDKAMLKQTVKSFSVSNEELARYGRRNTEGFSECVKTCEVLLKKMAGWSWSRYLLLVLFLVISALVALTVSIKASESKDFEISDVFEHLWFRTQFYSEQTYSWLSDNVPYYYAKVCDFSSPYLSLVQERLRIAGVFLLDVTQRERAWLYEKAVLFTQWGEETLPAHGEKLLLYLDYVGDVIHHYSSTLWSHSMFYTKQGIFWLNTNVFTGNFSMENVQRVLLAAASTVQEYCSSLYSWLNSILQ